MRLHPRSRDNRRSGTLIELLKDASPQASKYSAVFKDSQGTQIGDRDIQVNVFGSD